jgi:glyoxylase-like metal-dependent hydrolase (beta-lactamase superfamily II)
LANRKSAAPAGARLYLFEDTCNIVRDGAHCVLIDFGLGNVLDHLRDLGVNNVDWLMRTHHWW